LLSRKNLIAIGGLPGILGVLYVEEWIGYWFRFQITWLFLMTALVGGYAWAVNLPHPRQERKRREALALLLKAKENSVPAANATTGFYIPTPSPAEVFALDYDKETLAEKRP